ncbi:hypothetical protein B7486_62370 [cyanobacterium TDX16]|nr:hypothetical protein B7486_62370 [cyanobacterium TDX16]
MHVLALAVDLHLPESRSLKSRRAVVKPLLDGIRRRYGVSAAEVGHQQTWQRVAIGVAVVAGTAHHCTEVIDEVERFVWSHPEVQVLTMSRSWLELDD